MTNNDNHSNIISGIGECLKQWFFPDFDQNSRELDAAFKNNMLVVATPIVAVTFQTGISPPGSTWQDNKDGHEPGKAIFACHKISFHIFLILNTLAFSMSTQIILMLVYHEKLHFEIVVATVSMVATYGTAVWSVSPEKDVKLRYVCVADLFPYLWRFSYQTFKTFKCSSRQSSTK
ncbi:hypothetical protein LWI29_022345 [Acer saccharum]|uniref:PGG domain-containing protein n=1 Tax=Acer saccharum TaxID=4024 RepID=A0AA39VD26_ACESA|nr:hypothetical protein LWI29_022345 [Acer saccharum]